MPDAATRLRSPEGHEALAKLLGASGAFMKTGNPPPDDMTP
jgi:hypothetical protein